MTPFYALRRQSRHHYFDVFAVCNHFGTAPIKAQFLLKQSPFDRKKAVDMEPKLVLLAFALAFFYSSACEDGDSEAGESEVRGDPFGCFARGSCLYSFHLDAIAIDEESEFPARYYYNDQNIKRCPLCTQLYWGSDENRECQEFCNDNEDCEFFTLEEEKGVCVLLSECSEFKFGEDVSGWFQSLFFYFFFWGGQETKVGNTHFFGDNR